MSQAVDPQQNPKGAPLTPQVQPLPRRALIGFALLACLLSLLSHFPVASAPFGQGISDVNSGRYQGGIQRAYEKLGFWELRGAPHHTPLPSSPVYGYTYLNHPPLYHWGTRVSVAVFGYTEFGLRAYPILCCAILASILAWFAGVYGGGFAALATAVLYAALPMTTIYGSSSDFECPTLLFSMVAFLFLASPLPRRRRFGLGWLAVAVLHDWVAGFVLVGLVLYQFGSGSRPIRIRPLVMGGITCALMVILFLFLAAYWERGFASVFEILGYSLGSAREGVSGFTLGAFLSAQVTHTFDQFGLLPMLLAVVAIPWAVRRGTRGGHPMGGMILCWAGVSLLYICAFPGRAFDHDSWWYYFIPTVVIAGAAATSACWNAGFRIPAVLILLALSISAVTPSLDFYNGINSRWKELGETFNEHFDERDIVVAPYPGGAHYFYVDAWLVDGATDLQALRDLASAFAAGTFDADRLVFLTDPSWLFHDDITSAAAELEMESWSIGEFQVFELR